MIDRWIAEATECDFKVALEVKKPKSWLKSVSAFANGIGGTLFFGIDNDRNVIGLISRLIKERIMPYPNFILTPERESGKDILVLTVSAGRTTPYYYKADGVMEAYIRIGNESVIAPNYVLNQLVLKGMNRTYDALTSEYDFKDYAFSKLRERYKVWTGNSIEEKMFDSFDIKDEQGKLTNAGALLADDSPVRHSRLFCTRWNGLDKSGGIVDALDSAEYSGSLIILLNEGVGFVKRNMKTRWKKTADSRIEMPDYCERSFFEALVNGLIHRDYLILGSEVHIDIYDDHLTIYSPGGMADGTRVQERDLSNISSTRRNHQLLRSTEDGYYIEAPKTDSGYRQVPMSAAAYKAFQRVLHRRKDGKGVVVDGYKGFLFLNRDGLPKAAVNYDSMFQGLAKKFNKFHAEPLPEVMTPHTMRHTFCTRMANAGMNPKALQYIMGHSNIVMTLNYYAHATFLSAQEEMERLQAKAQTTAARSYGLYRHIRTSNEIIGNLLNDYNKS